MDLEEINTRLETALNRNIELSEQLKNLFDFYEKRFRLMSIGIATIIVMLLLMILWLYLW